MVSARQPSPGVRAQDHYPLEETMHAFFRAFGRCLAVAGLLFAFNVGAQQAITLHGAVQFNDDAAPPRYFPSFGVATHGSELSYIFDLPAAPIQAPFSPDSAALASSMRSAWASFAASGDPASGSDLRWPSFGNKQRVLSLRAPGSQVTSDFASRHHCGFWAEG
jgi:carboxylesterase type B